MTPLVMFHVNRPTHGRPFAWASCTVCGDGLHVRFSPDLGVTEQEAHSAASDWAQKHVSCHPAGQSLAADKAANWADEYLCDSMMGQYEDGAA